MFTQLPIPPLHLYEQWCHVHVGPAAIYSLSAAFILVCSIHSILASSSNHRVLIFNTNTTALNWNAGALFNIRHSNRPKPRAILLFYDNWAHEVTVGWWMWFTCLIWLSIMNPRVHCLCHFWLVLLIQNTKFSCRNRTNSNTNLSEISAHENWLTFCSDHNGFLEYFWLHNKIKNFPLNSKFMEIPMKPAFRGSFCRHCKLFSVSLAMKWLSSSPTLCGLASITHHVQATSCMSVHLPRNVFAKIFHEAIKTPASKLLSLLDATIFQESFSKADLESLFWREFLLPTENQLLTARLRALDYVFIYASYHPPTLLT